MCLELINVSEKFSSVCWLVWVFPGGAGSRQISISCLKLRMDYICCLHLSPFAKELVYWELIWCFCCWLVDMVFIREETEKSPAHGWWCGRAAGGHMADQLVANLLFPLPCEKYIDLLGDFTIMLYIILKAPFPLSDVAQQSAYICLVFLCNWFCEGFCNCRLRIWAIAKGTCFVYKIIS